MPDFVLSEGENDDPAERGLFMRWLERDEQYPELIEICVGPPRRTPDLGKRIRPGLTDVELRSTSIVEHLEPDPPGTPVPLGRGGQVLRTCELGGALFDGE